jgi:hypothetical protein
MIPGPRVAALSVAACWLVATDARHGAECRVRGVWEIVSVTTDGKEETPNGWKRLEADEGGDRTALRLDQ